MQYLDFDEALFLFFSQYSVLVYPDLICRTKKLFLLSVTKGQYNVLLKLNIFEGHVSHCSLYYPKAFCLRNIQLNDF